MSGAHKLKWTFKWTIGPAMLGLSVLWYIKAEHSFSFQVIPRKPQFIYHMPHCHLPELDPWDKSIMTHVTREEIPHCNWTSKLTFTQGHLLRVNATLLAGRYNVTSCEYQAVRRGENTDNSAYLGPVVKFKPEEVAQITDEFIKVSCYVHKLRNHHTERLAYTNYHALVLDKPLPQNKNGTAMYTAAAADHSNTGSQSDQWNVILLGTDSMSRSAGVRYLPKTRKFLLDVLDSVEMMGYTKVGLNTFPNMVPFLTGHHLNDILEDGKEQGPFDYLPLIFKNYSMAGYKTFFAEDSPQLAMFNYLCKGFNQPPTDYYYRPLSLLVEMDPNLMAQPCEKPLTMSRMIANYLQSFATNFKRQRFIALMFLTQLSHDEQTESRRLDQVYHELLTQLKQEGIWQRTFLLFFGDHGARWGGLMSTDVGLMEGKAPMMYVAAPKAFRDAHPDYFQNLKYNADRLTTAFDAYATLRNILVVGDGVSERKHGLSLFSPIPATRTCDDAGIPLPFCICYRKVEVRADDLAVQRGAQHLAAEINGILSESLQSKTRCAKLKLYNVSSASKFTIISGGDIMYQIVFSTWPGYGKFEGLVQANRDLREDIGHASSTSWELKNAFARKGDISRLNKYGNQSACITTREHKLYCYCA